MTERLFLCTDLDRTLLPNGPQPETPRARKRFAHLASRPQVTIAYVTGRHRALVEAAMIDYALPLPDYVLADVGTTIYEVTESGWQVWSEWQDEIAPDWAGMDRVAVQALFADLGQLRLQEPAKQNAFKLSYYVPLESDSDLLLKEMQARLDARAIRASLIWSIDEPAQIGLLDVLPARATKYHAIQFVIQRQGFSPQEVVFAGDSGNDLPVLTSKLQAVLVANASSEVRQRAQQEARDKGTQDRLYLARGGFCGMNGNYAAGILEGVAHYNPRTAEWWE
ncbi:MAG: HAD-IIB family hydrolase [Pseudomonadota bacterium]